MNCEKKALLTGMIVLLLACVLRLSYAQQEMAAGNAGENSLTSKAGYENRDYLFGPDDVIRIIVDEHAELSGEFTVKPDGNIFIPMLGDFRAGGRNKDELESLLTKYFSKYISQTVCVLGEVNRPGEYPTGGKAITLKDAIILAGLPAKYAATGRVFIISPSSGKPNRKVVNLYRILYRGELERNIQLNPGDIVYVPQTLIGKVAGLFDVILGPLTTVRVATTVGQ